MARRSGSVWTGCGTVFMKEFADHLGSGRMRVLEWLVLLTGIGAVYTAIQDLKTTTSQDPFLFLRLFTDAHDPLPSFMAVLGFLIPLVAIGLGFDAINGEFNRRTMSRILAQPVYRDALLLGKFFAGIATLGVALVTLWLLIIGLGLLTLGVPPTGEEVIRGISFLIVSLAYGGLWLAVAMLCSVIFLGAGRARSLAAHERALALALAIHHQRDLSDDAAQSHPRPQLRAAHAAADSRAALAEHALCRIALGHHASLDPRPRPGVHGAAPRRGDG
jgi:ABC-2 type transport system permease protein